MLESRRICQPLSIKDIKETLDSIPADKENSTVRVAIIDQLAEDLDDPEEDPHSIDYFKSKPECYKISYYPACDIESTKEGKVILQTGNIFEPKERSALETNIEALERFQDRTFAAFRVKSKPHGHTWLLMVLDIARKIAADPGLLEAITEKDLDQLTQDNYHTARHAAEVLLNLKEYMI